ncbi:putative suppressor of forked, acetyltransferase A, auxiliary subunit [Rosa chinensis]|uniref:Putative suppressor of forked, acetyltransferase A, auxiliary subunit n=1 Tax=Rosa chinensis TaxID=74649 RepID=A0A2P6RYT1_ROSCH|nr:cleavage stimulation factor subunit 77 [Rosa chinensis]PRQ51584.1 putative suppressor of forked, acetyltransferase A, auxiliary subunit [Rosa chinensis]
MDPKYNVQAASYQANQARRLPISEAAPIYENLLTAFPTAAKYWTQYAEAQMAANDDEATKNIFSRCLMKCRHLPLWQTYINFIRRVNANNGQEGQDLIRKAFDFVISCVGDDITSGPVWLDYISFLKSSNQIVSLRKAYQKAFLTPNHHMDQLWSEYQSFENTYNKDLAKSLLAEFSHKFKGAKAAYWERRNVVKDIDFGMLAVPPTGSPREEGQWMAWKKLLAFDKENRQRIDIASCNKRIELAYEQCLMYLCHYPDMWYDYAMWLVKSGSMDAAVKVFERALKAVPESEMLRYAYADLEESRGEIKAAKKIYESLLGDGGTGTSPGLAQIQFLRFLRRTEGIEAARSYFLEARKSPNCTYNVYVAYANIALCHDKNMKLAHNVFEAGMKLFMHEPEYILEYLEHLIRLNDDMNARALFERALCSLPTEKSVEILNRFVKFEQTYGNLTSMLKVEQRKKEALSRIGGEEQPLSLESSLQDVVSRYSFRNLCPCSMKDLDHLTRQESLSRNKNRKVDSSSPVPTEAKPSVVPDSSVPVSTKVVYPATNQTTPTTAVVPNTVLQSQTPVAGNVQTTMALVGGDPKFDDILKTTPALVAFLTNMPQQVGGPTPDVDVVLSFVLQSDIPSNSTSRKRKANEWEVVKEVKHQPIFPVDVFKMRQLQKYHPTGSQTGSASCGSSSCSSGDYTVVTRNTI